MSTRKIIDPKQNGEKVWPKGHTKAIYMSDDSTVEDTIKNIEIGGGNIDLSDYETKSEAQSKLQQALDYTDTSYPLQEELSVSQALNGLDDTEYDNIKSHVGSFSTYIDGYGWTSGLNKSELSKFVSTDSTT